MEDDTYSISSSVIAVGIFSSKKFDHRSFRKKKKFKRNYLTIYQFVICARFMH